MVPRGLGGALNLSTHNPFHSSLSRASALHPATNMLSVCGCVGKKKIYFTSLLQCGESHVRCFNAHRKQVTGSSIYNGCHEGTSGVWSHRKYSTLDSKFKPSGKYIFYIPESFARQLEPNDVWGAIEVSNDHGNQLVREQTKQTNTFLGEF